MQETNAKICVEKLVECQVELYAFIGALMPDHKSDIGDVVQETNVKVISSASDYNSSRPFRPWLWAFARNEVKTYLADRARSPLVFDDTLARSAAESFSSQPDEAEETTAQLLKHLDICKSRLPPKYIDLLDRRYKAQESIEEIAAAKHSNAHTVTTTLGYIRKKLGECIRRLCRLEKDSDTPGDILTPGMQELNAYLEKQDVWTRDAASRFRDLVRSPGMMDFWLGQNRVHALLRWEAKAFCFLPQTGIQSSRVFPWRRTLAFAAGLAMFLAGGVWLCVFLGGTHVKLQSRETTAVSLQPIADSPQPIASSQPSPANCQQPTAPSQLQKNNGQQPIADRHLSRASTAADNTPPPVLAIQTQGDTTMKKENMPSAVVTAARAVAMVVAASSAARATDALDTVYVNVPRYWQTAYTNEIPVCWDWGPANATKALFSYEGMNSSWSNGFIRSAGDASVFLPVSSTDENLYTVRLAYMDDSGATLSALTGQVACVHGAIRSGEVSLPVVDVSCTATNLSKVQAWPRALRPGAKGDNVVFSYDTAWVTTNAVSSASLAIVKQKDGRNVTLPLETPGGWIKWQPVKEGWGTGWFSFTLTAGGNQLAASVYRPVQGLVISLR